MRPSSTTLGLGSTAVILHLSGCILTSSSSLAPLTSHFIAIVSSVEIVNQHTVFVMGELPYGVH